MKKYIFECIVLLFMFAHLAETAQVNSVAYGNFTHEQQNNILKIVH